MYGFCLFWEIYGLRARIEDFFGRDMVRTNIGVKWMDVPENPLTGTIAYEVHTKRFIPGPANYEGNVCMCVCMYVCMLGVCVPVSIHVCM